NDGQRIAGSEFRQHVDALGKGLPALHGGPEVDSVVRLDGNPEVLEGALETALQDLAIGHEGAGDRLQLALEVPVSIEGLELDGGAFLSQHAGQVGSDAAVPVDQRAVAVEGE